MRKLIDILKRKNIDMGIWLSKLQGRIQVEVYMDASYGNEEQDRIYCIAEG